jgi:hypothetical protein
VLDCVEYPVPGLPTNSRTSYTPNGQEFVALYYLVADILAATIFYSYHRHRANIGVG